MTNYIVNSPQTLLTGTTSNDTFDLTTALAVSLFGIEGADVFSGAATTYNQSILNGGAGNDTIVFQATGSATLAQFLGGGGDDAISGGLSDTGEFILLQGGGGNDTINYNGSGGITTASTINGNGGDDLIVFSGTTWTNALFAAGGGNDTMTGTFVDIDSATIIGGGGNDVISADIGTGTVAAVFAGDTNLVQSEWDGNDTINILGGANLTDGLIQGNGGNDSIDLNAIGAGTTVGGNAGQDTINIGTTLAAARFQVHAGADADVISAAFASGGGHTDASIFGGGGNDSITIDSKVTAKAVTAYFFGDAGADFFTLGGSTGVGSNQSVAYGGAAASNLAAFDTVTANGSGFSIAEFFVNNAAIGSATAAVGFSAQTDGEVLFSNTYALGVTARTQAVASLTDDAGSTYFFSDGVGRSYVFMEGGSSSTSDDLLVQAGSAQVISGIVVAGIGAGLPGSKINVSLM